MGWHTICKVKKDEVNEFDKERAEFLKKAVTSIVTAYYGDEDNYDFRNNMKSIEECKYDTVEKYMKNLGSIEELTASSIDKAVENLTAKRKAREEEAAASRKRAAEYQKRKVAQAEPSALEKMDAERLEREAAEKSSKSEPKPIIVSDFEAQQIAHEEESAFVEDQHYDKAEARAIKRLSRRSRTEPEPHEHK